ncbi:MAG: hypothetical protein DRJ15_08725 [Bacteroidetes bacterium]|nr:MAG: hypothetical protein DRJ15_08725 [Bacteroidota bacterium]
MRIFDEKIKFDEAEHKYTYRDVEMESVTTFLGRHSKEFDTDTHSKRVATKRKISQETVLAEWEANKEYALDFGTKIHHYAENAYKGLPNKETIDERELAYRAIVDKYMDEHKRLRLVASELQLVSPIHRLAGTVDLLLTDGKGKYFMYDWKTSKEINEFSKYKDRMLAPLDYLDDCNFTKYSLQLNLYNYMLHKKGIYPNGLYIVHLTSSGYKEFKVPFMDDEIQALLIMRLHEIAKTK